MIAIIDYGAGNLKSVQKAFEFLGADILVTSDSDTIKSADGVILPGVGSFGDAMANLRSRSLENVINDVINKNTPFLGICLGLQLLLEESEESPKVTGLGIIKGKNVKIPKIDDIKIPHMGWNSLNIIKENRLFKGIKQDTFVYFVHSYYMKAVDNSVVLATTDYGTTLDIAIEANNLFATQFHPEKSGKDGLKILSNFIDITGGVL